MQTDQTTKSALTSPDPAKSAPVTRRDGRLAALDGMRLVAALLVVLFHYVGTSTSKIWPEHNAVEFPGLYQVSTYGFLGVQFFFIISGFVICMSSWDRSLKDFFISRTVRLYPMYWAAIIMTLTVVLLAGNVASTISVIHTPKDLADILLNFTMFQDVFRVYAVDAVYWTLWVEVSFYLLFAIVVMRGLTYQRVVTFCALWLIATLVSTAGDLTVLHVIVQPSYSVYFVAGILFYLMHRFGSTPLLWGMVAVCFLVAQHGALGSITAMNDMLGTNMKWRYAALLIAVFFVAIAAVALRWLSWARWRWLTVAGVLTYPLYLLHQNIGIIIIRSLSDQMSKWLLLPGTIAAMLLLAYAAHRLVEKPLAPRLKRALLVSFERMRPAIEPPAAASIPSQHVAAETLDADLMDTTGEWPTTVGRHGEKPHAVAGSAGGSFPAGSGQHE